MKPVGVKMFFVEGSLRYWYAIIAIVCFGVYFNTIFNDYSLDDHLVSNHNPVIEKGLSGLGEIFTTNYIAEEDINLDYRPLVKATFAVEYALFGWNPHISHFINVLLFAFACCLIFKTLLQAFGRRYFNVLITGMILYVVHPVHTEVVAGLKNRDELLVLIFAFSSAYLFLRYMQTDDKKFFAFGLLVFLLALLSKISCLPFIASIPLFLCFAVGGIKRPFYVFVSLAALAGIYYLIVIQSLPGFTRPYDFVETPFPYIKETTVKAGTAFYSLLYYIGFLLTPGRFSFYYGYNYVELKSMLSLAPLVSFVVHFSIFVMGVYFLKRNGFVSFFLLFYLVQISLYSNIIQPLAGIVAERAALFASLSFTILVAYWLNYIFSLKFEQLNEEANRQSKQLSKLALRIRPKHLTAAILLIAFYSVETVARNSDWQNTISIFEADMPHLQSSARANYMMAHEIRRLYRIDKDLTPQKLEEQSARAIEYYNRAIKVYPNYAQAMEELGAIYAIELKNPSMAMPLFEKALSIDSTLWKSASNLARCYQIQKDTNNAVFWYEKSLKANPKNAKVLVELSKLYYMQGNKAKALAGNDALMKLSPESYVPYYNYGIYYMMENDTLKAVKYFEEDIQHGDPEKFPYFFLMNYYLEAGDTLSAIRVRNSAPKVSR